MTRINWLLVIALLALAALPARADSTQSYTGTLGSPYDDFEVLLTLTATSNVTIQTYGFGGGTNANGTVIAPGGTDPFVGLFANLGLSPTFIDGTSLDLTNYTPGCPAAKPYPILATPLAATSCSPSAIWPPALTPSSFQMASSSRSPPWARAPRSTTVFSISPAEFSATCRTWIAAPTVRILPARSPSMSPRARHPRRPPSLPRSCSSAPVWQSHSAFASAAPSSKSAAC